MYQLNVNQRLRFGVKEMTSLRFFLYCYNNANQGFGVQTIMFHEPEIVDIAH